MRTRLHATRSFGHRQLPDSSLRQTMPLTPHCYLSASTQMHLPQASARPCLGCSPLMRAGSLQRQLSAGKGMDPWKALTLAPVTPLTRSLSSIRRQLGAGVLRAASKEHEGGEVVHKAAEQKSGTSTAVLAVHPAILLFD